jgi:hypothetical protein
VSHPNKNQQISLNTYHGTGDFDTGDFDTGDFDTGDFDTGDFDTGDFDTGADDFLVDLIAGAFLLLGFSIHPP